MKWLWWVIPILVLFVLYWEGLQGWFIDDDFAWLGLLRQAHDFRGVIDILFTPAAQGTIRPWSERGFFLVFESIFGIDPFPFRLMAFITMAADLVLLQWITRRITHSRLAGFVAAICWIANPALVRVMSWSSAYNEALCPFFLLAAMALFFRFAETGRRRFWWWQLVVFSLGFGVLEINVVYPAIAAAWVLFIAPAEKRRTLLLSLIPLFVLSVLYFVVHRLVAPLPSTGFYAIHLDSRIFSTMFTYAKWSLVPMDWAAFGHSATLGRIFRIVEALALVILFAAEMKRRRWTILFFAAWFFATLAPMLVLPYHLDDYYLTIPMLGFAMLAAWGVTCAARDLGKWRLLTAIPVVAYLGAAVPVSHAATHWWFEKSLSVRGLVLGVAAAHETHPDKFIVLSGVTSELFNHAVGHSAFFPFGIDNVYLAPGSGKQIAAEGDNADLNDLVLDNATMEHAVADNKLVLYSVAGDHLRNITEQYERSAPNRFTGRLPSRVNVGNPLYSWLLSKEWLPAENGFRWMPGEASVHLGGPEHAGGKLRIEGYCPEEQLKSAPRRLSVTVDGEPVGETQINDPESNFVRLFDLPSSATGKQSIDVTIRVTPVERRGGVSYGLIFGGIAIQP